MAFVTYEARRGLAASHVAGLDYTLALVVSDLQRPTGTDLKSTQRSISGKTETQFYGEERIWSITLAPMRIMDADIYYEFLRSTADGQEFTFDPYGTPDHNVQLLTVVREDTGYSEGLFQREGRGGLSDWVSLGFQVREA